MVINARLYVANSVQEKSGDGKMILKPIFSEDLDNVDCLLSKLTRVVWGDKRHAYGDECVGEIGLLVRYNC